MSDTPIHEGLGQLSAKVRPEILKLARRRKLIDTCFKEFQRAVYPGAGPDQVAELRVAFTAGAAEFYAVMMYGTELCSDVSTDDMDLMRGVTEEIEAFHQHTIDTSSAGGTRQ